MNLSDFDYELPEKLIADYPAEPRDESRLLILDKVNHKIVHDKFFNLSKYLRAGDILVLNNSKVYPARLVGQKKETGGKVEILLNHELIDGEWEVLGKGLKIGATIVFDGSLLECVVNAQNDNCYTVKFNLDCEPFFDEVEKIGNVPIPPYIESKRDVSDIRKKADKENYQTVYAKERGSVAAPTAGLHFTEKVFSDLRERGVDVEELTLHVGLGTFAPVKVDDITKHQIHREFFSIQKDVVRKLILAKKTGHRIVTVGTTSTRVLEYVFSDEKILGSLNESSASTISGWTDIYIYPGYKFKIVDGIVTNFHLPKSTLIMLVSAFAGSDNIKAAYQEAIKNEYRFYSYGDAMIII
ncbi:MAG: tRNA preQ1(34) S-adenosylmethionine ribosyltransferase-isomerase QueA [Candidatus Berkelbacteria bacterium]